MKEESWKLAQEAFTIEAGALEAMGGILDREIVDRTVQSLAAAPRIGASGCGHTGIALRHFVHLMCCIERPARFLSPADALHGALGFLQKGDVMFLASRGGKTAELAPIIEFCKHRGVTLIGLTENSDSPLAGDVDIFFPMKVSREVDRYNVQGTTSFMVMCAIFDALQAALIEEINYQSEKFALVHPGGAVGERLNKKG
jgi:D-arabinose 5-phosphate isomerase GutQ